MIKAQDLRIGVYVNLKDKGVYCIDSGHDIETIEYCWTGTDYCEAIPLTEEWLVKFGFKEGVNEFEVYWIDLNGIDQQLEIIESCGYYYPRLVQSPEFSHEDCQVVPLKRIQFVHQLQNLYFVLSDQELTIQS